MIRKNWLLVCVILPFFAFTPAKKNSSETFSDLSSPEKSFQSFVIALKSGDVADLERVATESGLASLDVLSQDEDYKGEKKVLGEELEKTQVRFEDITDEIVLASAQGKVKTHKMEFVETENGWMLYHWQIGSAQGVEAH